MSFRIILSDGTVVLFKYRIRGQHPSVGVYTQEPLKRSHTGLLISVKKPSFAELDQRENDLAVVF